MVLQLLESRSCVNGGHILGPDSSTAYRSSIVKIPPKLMLNECRIRGFALTVFSALVDSKRLTNPAPELFSFLGSAQNPNQTRSTDAVAYAALNTEKIFNHLDTFLIR